MLSVQPKSPVIAADVPRHIAIIMDGNGRWASARHLPRAMGHRRGAESVRKAVKGCIRQGVRVLTLYAFSSENWKRPAEEVDDLMALLRLYLKREIRELHSNGVSVRFIGDMAGLPADLQDMVRDSEELTAANEKLTLVIALNYGSQAEIVRACRIIAGKVASGDLAPDAIDEAMFREHLQIADLPYPDLVIRTSGERRLSNFLLWQSAYAELLFLDILWPDFDEKALAAAIDDYKLRERRFGGR